MNQWEREMSLKHLVLNGHNDCRFVFFSFLFPGTNAEETHCPQTFQSVPGKQKKT